MFFNFRKKRGTNLIIQGLTTGKILLAFASENVCAIRVLNRLLEIRCVRSSPLIRPADTVSDPRQFTRVMVARVEGASGNRIGFVSRAKEWLDGPGAVHRVNFGMRPKLPVSYLPPRQIHF
jgi:hypothetical protein